MEHWGSGGESVLALSLVALRTYYIKVWSVMRDLFWKNKVSFAEEAIGNINFEDKYLHSLIT